MNILLRASLSKRRSIAQINLKILSIIFENQAIKSTPLSQHANINYMQLKDQLKLLIASGYVKNNDVRGRKIYTLTANGGKLRIVLKKLEEEGLL